MPAAYRCTACAVAWPYQGAYVLCPQCGASCWRSSSDEPMPFHEAESLRKHAEFERYCEKRDRDRYLEAQRLIGSVLTD